jgi:hypothetical protein
MAKKVFVTPININHSIQQLFSTERELDWGTHPVGMAKMRDVPMDPRAWKRTRLTSWLLFVLESQPPRPWEAPGDRHLMVTVNMTLNC